MVLWCGFGVVGRSKRFYFAGDTGYRTAPSNRSDPENGPVCPAFAEIGHRVGPFDLAAIPVGAYEPRAVMSSFHANPNDAVNIHKDIQARKSLGVHWGSWILTLEPTMDPPARLAEARAAHGIAEDAFVTCNPGNTLRV
jgi:N-acyl-phosphatidylethanolamine-hydrolysing phospholipase D